VAITKRVQVVLGIFFSFDWVMSLAQNVRHEKRMTPSRYSVSEIAAHFHMAPNHAKDSGAAKKPNWLYIAFNFARHSSPFNFAIGAY
jgi:hypothetical protein